jgi:hypothetical protein
VAFAQPREVLCEGDVEDPVQGVLDAPVLSDGFCEGLRGERPRASGAAGESNVMC